MRIILMFIMLCSTWVHAQYSTISGKVTNAMNNNALVGVLVTNQQTQVTTLTDENGTYSIKAKEGNALRFTLDGYDTQEVVVKNNSQDLDIQLKAINVREIHEYELS